MRKTLNTNICSYILRCRPMNIVERFSGINRAELWLSTMVAAELRFGSLKLNSPRFQASIESWLAGFEVLSWSNTASQYYAQIRLALEKLGKPIGNMDLMIAAHALAQDSVLITNNAKEFHRVPGLAVEEWRMDVE